VNPRRTHRHGAEADSRRQVSGAAPASIVSNANKLAALGDVSNAGIADLLVAVPAIKRRGPRGLDGLIKRRAGLPSNRKEPRLRLSLPAGAVLVRCGANWEHRSIYIAPRPPPPFFCSPFLTALTPAEASARTARRPYEFAAAADQDGFIVGILLSRRAVRRAPRSQLLSESSPVPTSHRASKFAIPLVILPLLSFASPFTSSHALSSAVSYWAAA